jgi:ABC transport system ATP-binding/permease protein
MATGPVLAQVKTVQLTMGGAPLFEGASFALHRGERVCLIGQNGAGKSTLLKMLAGEVEPDGGEIARMSGVTFAYMAQEPDLSGFESLSVYVEAAGVPAHKAEAELFAFDLDPARAPQGLSGGEVRRASLARVFAQSPDVLLLDEPTNHLDIAAITALEERLLRFSGASLIISHDRRFLETVSTACLWLRRRAVRRLDAGFAEFEAFAEILELEDARALSRLETQLKAEEHWLQRGVTARRSRNEGRRRKLMAMRTERRERKSEGRSQAGVAMSAGQASGRQVIEAKGLTFAYPDAADQPLVKDLSLRLMRGDRLGLIGPNGAGKTTLLKLLLGRLAPTGGTVRIGSELTLAVVDQDRARLDPDKTVWETLCPLGGDQVIVRGHPRHVAAYAADFLFTSAQLRQPARALSGGERNRLSLAVALAQPANLLILDEPTNDLDMETLDVLEEALAAYDGTVILVSHDRAFLNGAVTQVLGPVGAGRWAESPGDYDDFLREHGGPARTKPQAKSEPVRPTASSPAPKAASRKLSYKDQRRLEECEALMPRLTVEIALLESKLASPEAYEKGQEHFQSLVKTLETQKRQLEEAEADWLTLEEKRLDLEQG